MTEMNVFNKYGKSQKNEEKKEIGNFIPAESRREVAKELKRTHFQLGNDKNEYQSKYQQQDNWNVEQSKETHKIAQQIKQSHIQLGQDGKFSQQTTHLQDYNKKSIDLSQVSEAKETKQDLRKAHFSFGNDVSQNLITTNMERFQNNAINQNNCLKMSNESDKLKSGQVSIVYGNDKQLYQSSTKESMIQHDMEQSFKNREQMKQQSKSLRRHNFQLGYQNQNQNTDAQISKVQMRSNSVADNSSLIQEIKKNHFELGNKREQPDYISIAKMGQDNLAQQLYSQNKIQDLHQAKLENQKPHFKFGNADTQIQSVAQNDFKYKQDEISNQSIQQTKLIKEKMQRGNVNIGDQNNRQLQTETTYKQSIASETKKLLENSQNNEDIRRHLHGSIKLGTNDVNFESEAKAKFTSQQKDVTQNNKQLIDKNRQSHFQLRDGTQQEMTSVSKTNFDYKGNAATIRSMLDNTTMQSLKNHHFQMGTHNNEFSLTSTQKRNNESDKQSKTVEAKSMLKNSGQRVFSTSRTDDFKTTNQCYLKWIQPNPQNVRISG